MDGHKGGKRYFFQRNRAAHGASAAFAAASAPNNPAGTSNNPAGTPNSPASAPNSLTSVSNSPASAANVMMAASNNAVANNQITDNPASASNMTAASSPAVAASPVAEASFVTTSSPVAPNSNPQLAGNLDQNQYSAANNTQNPDFSANFVQNSTNPANLVQNSANPANSIQNPAQKLQNPANSAENQLNSKNSTFESANASTKTGVKRDAEFSNEAILQLLWPKMLIARIHDLRTIRLWSTPLAVINYILASLLGILLGPVQLILMVVTEDYLYATEVYFPFVLRFAMIFSGIVAVSIAIDMVQTWREQPRRSITTVILGSGSALILLMIWAEGKFNILDANQLTLVMIILIALTGALALSASRTFYSTEKHHTGLSVAMILAVLLASTEAISGFVYLFTKSNSAEEVQTALEALGKKQQAAQISGISAELSDLVFTLCASAYDAVFVASDPSSGLFECRENHEVYSVSGPFIPESSSSSGSLLIGRAFYFGKTQDDAVSQYFPAETGVKYLYRDLTTTDQASELILLLPAASEETLVNNYLDQLTSFINSYVAANLANQRSNDLRLSIFYNPELNSVVNTRDFILTTAAGTLAMTDYLPRGSSLKGYINGQNGTFVYYTEPELVALSELGASPLLYSSQTRAAITINRHISLTLDGLHSYTADELREILYQSFLDPIAAVTE